MNLEVLINLNRKVNLLPSLNLVIELFIKCRLNTAVLEFAVKLSTN